MMSDFATKTSGEGDAVVLQSIGEAGEGLIRVSMGQMNLSARGYHQVLKLSRTIADLVDLGSAFSGTYSVP